jgi:hypothetical protein
LSASALPSILTGARQRFIDAVLERVLTAHGGIATNADKDSRASVEIARGILERLGTEVQRERLAGQSSGNTFEDLCATFLRESFLRLEHLRPGRWKVIRAGDGTEPGVIIANFEQYRHLLALSQLAKKDRQLAAALRADYAIRPDIVVVRYPEPDATLNASVDAVDDASAERSPLRQTNNPYPILHASVSCKWTLRSDRAQNARSEALNLIRNRKGRAPHIVVVTGEPLPSRIASIALGTGDVDCVYHFALPELLDTLDALGYEDAREMAAIMVEGKRLRDISDLPLDLVI